MNLHYYLTRGKSRSHICGHADCDRLYVTDGPFADAALARAAARVDDASETVVRVLSDTEIERIRAAGVKVFDCHVTEGMF